jgi:hypothetical protein
MTFFFRVLPSLAHDRTPCLPLRISKIGESYVVEDAGGVALAYVFSRRIRVDTDC